MASVIVNFPSGSKVEKQIKTAYRTANGLDYIVLNTDKKDNENEVFGVTYRTSKGERFEKIVNMEEWKKAKLLMMADLRDQKDTFTYFVPEKEIQVTEDFMKEIALREENSRKIGDNYEAFYEEFLKAQQSKANEPTEQMVAETPFVTESATPSPVIEESKTVEFPNIQNTSVEPPQMQNENEIPKVPIQESVNEIQQEPIINSTIVPDPTPVIQENNNNSEISAVTKYYVDTMNALTSQLNEITEKYIEVTRKCQSTVSEISGKVIGLLEEVNKRDELSKQTFDKGQQILMEQEKEEPILAKVA